MRVRRTDTAYVQVCVLWPCNQMVKGPVYTDARHHPVTLSAGRADRKGMDGFMEFCLLFFLSAHSVSPLVLTPGKEQFEGTVASTGSMFADGENIADLLT